MVPNAGRRILLVEDDEPTLDAYRALLEHAGWEVAVAMAGDEALRLAAATPPDLALIDISIPGVDGWETTRRLRAAAATRHLPVIAVTGHALAEDLARAREVGCDAYLVKPVDPQQLLAEADRLTAAGRAGAPLPASDA